MYFIYPTSVQQFFPILSMLSNFSQNDCANRSFCSRTRIFILRHNVSTFTVGMIVSRGMTGTSTLGAWCIICGYNHVPSVSVKALFKRCGGSRPLTTAQRRMDDEPPPWLFPAYRYLHNRVTGLAVYGITGFSDETTKPARSQPNEREFTNGSGDRALAYHGPRA